jgi:hypothetical protein
LERLRRFSWFERIKTGPSPDDEALLRITRELAELFDVRVWYKGILWGRFERGGLGWMISKPVSPFYPGTLAIRGPSFESELILPEYLKGKLSMDSWRFLIGLHMVRMHANLTSGRFAKVFGVGVLPILGTFALGVILQHVIGEPWGFAIFTAVLLSGLLPTLLYARSRLGRWELELDREAAGKLGTDGIIRVLEQMKFLDPRANHSTIQARFAAFWNVSIEDRLEALKSPWPGIPRRSWRPRVGLRLRAALVGIGFAIFWSSGFAANLFYGQGRTGFACTTTGCAVLVVSAAVGYWLAILAGLSLVIGIIQRLRRSRPMSTRTEG